MPYVNGKSVTQEELYKIEKWEESHKSLTKSANIMAAILAVFVFLAGIVGIAFVLYSLITSGDVGLQAIGWLAGTSLTIMVVLSIFFTRFEI